MKFLSTYRSIFLAASLVIAGGATVFFGHAQAQNTQSGKTVQSVLITVKDDIRYISAYGIPRHAAKNYSALGIVPKSYAFKVDAKPKASGAPTYIKPDQIFGVSLDGVPIKHAVKSLWKDNERWPLLERNLDAYGGTLIGDTYVYGGVPKGLLSKDLTHVGYAADGFPIFVSKGNSLETSYRLKEGNREAPPLEPGGPYDGNYLTDYHYIAKAGLLDACGGVKVKNKYYIYIITADAPQIPLCWTGRPDPTFLSSGLVKIPEAQRDEFGVEGLRKPLR
jgi:hypothetical protein